MFSVISRRLASQLGLMPIDKGFAHTVQGTYEPSVYLLDVMLPNGMVVKNRHVSDGDFDDCDVLIRSGRLSTGQPGVRDVRGAQANPSCVRESEYDASGKTSPKIMTKRNTMIALRGQSTDIRRAKLADEVGRARS